MSSAPVSLWLLVGFTVVAYLSVRPFLQILKNELPSTYVELGTPNFWSIFSRNPNDWGMQFRFLGFILSGRAVKQTGGNARILACVIFVAYLGILANVAFLAYELPSIARH